MNFRTIHLQNFRSHVDTTLELAPLTVIRGGNAVGKSSLEQAIEIAVASCADGTTSDGKGSVNLIRAGAAKALISLELDTDGEAHSLKCALNDTRRTVLVGKPGDPQYAGGAEWLDWLGTHKETLCCLINNRHFINLRPAEQQDVLAAIILPKTYDWPEWIKPLCYQSGLKVNWARTPFEIIDEAYDAAFKARTDANRDLKNFRMPEGDTAGWNQLEDLSHRLGERRAELDIAKSKKYTLEASVRSNSQLLTAAEDRLTAATARLSREQQEIPALEANLLSPPKIKELEKVAKSAKRAAEIDAQLVAYDADIRANQESLKSFNKLTGECPACKTVITDAHVEAITKSIVQARAHLDSLKEGSLVTRKTLGDPAGAQKSIDAHAKATIDMQRAKDRIKEEQTAIADAEAKIAELKESAKKQNTEAIAELDKQIADLAAKVERGNTAVAAVRSAKELKGRIEGAEAERATLVKRQAGLEKLVKYFGSEVKSELLAGSIGTFTAAMNDVLAQWGYECQLSIEPYVFAVIYRDSDQKAHPIALANLSKSERYRFSVALQMALAVFTGFKFVIVDESDIFDSLGRRTLFTALTSGQLDQAIVLGTDERLEVPDFAGAAFYHFADVATTGMIPTTQVKRLVPQKAEAA